MNAESEFLWTEYEMKRKEGRASRPSQVLFAHVCQIIKRTVLTFDIHVVASELGRKLSILVLWHCGPEIQEK